MTNRLANIITSTFIIIILSNKSIINCNLNPSALECGTGCYKVRVPIFGERCVCPPKRKSNIFYKFIFQDNSKMESFH